MKKILILIMVLSLFLVTGCERKTKYITNGTIEGITFKETDEVTNYIKIEMKSNDLIIMELYPEIAPITVENFQKLVSEKYYDGIIYHRVIKNFMIQTGDPTGTGSGGSLETIKGEFDLNGVVNNLSHERGVVSMARRGANPDTSETMNSASSQFFIVHKDSPHLNGSYAAFGRVIAGMSTVDKIAEVNTDANDKPLIEQKIKTIRFVTISK